MLDADLLRLLCCPEDRTPLAIAEPALVASINEKIRQGGLRNRSGTLITEPIESGLVRSDRRFLYPIRQQIPVLLVDEAIPLGTPAT